MTDFAAVIPVVIVTLSAAAAMLAEAFRQPDERMPIWGLGLIGLGGAAAASVLLWNRDATGFGAIRSDNFALFLNLVLCLVGAVTILLSAGTVERDRLPQGEYYALMLFSIAGMMLMGSAIDLLVIFLALEILSLGVYVMTGLRRDSAAGAEAAFKYFLLGSFSSAFFLYGIALTFTVTGTTRLEQIGVALAAKSMSPGILTAIAVGLLLVGFAFKVSAVPFHMWTPDAYEGAPTVVTGFMSTGVKAAAFAAFLRVFLWSLEPKRTQWIRVSAVAGRPSADGRLHRQVVHLQRRRSGRLLLACDHRRADERRLRLLLPPNRRHDVHDRGAGRGTGSSAVTRGARRAGVCHHRRLLSGRASGARARHRDGLCEDHFLGSIGFDWVREDSTPTQSVES
jgi:hypothetical protein